MSKNESATVSPSAMANAEAKPTRSRARKKPSRKTGGKKSTGSRTRPESRPSPRPAPSEDEIRLRAYFLAEKRAQLSLPGDTQSDWIEAKRQLFEEAGVPLT